MRCALLAPLHAETNFVHTIPWNDVPLLFKCSPKILIESARLSDKQTLSVISVVKEIAKDVKAIWCQKAKIDLSRIRYC